MRQVTYAGESFLVSDDVADVLLDLGAALANGGRAMHVKVPCVGVDDEPVWIGLVLGPASQFACRPSSSHAVPDDADFVARARDAIRSIMEVAPFPIGFQDTSD